MDKIIELDLEAIRTDPGQPRQLLPPQLVQELVEGVPPTQVIEKFEKTDDTGKLIELWELANSILSEGLIQPITVRLALGQGKAEYIIVAGERRYWAHWLLVRKYGPQHAKIRCIVHEAQGSVRAVQLIENVQRADLGAVEIAVNLALLIGDMDELELSTTVDLLQQSRGIASRRLTQGTWAEVTKRIGRTRKHWSHYLSLLQLPNDVLELARLHSLSEWSLRPVVAEKEPVRQFAMVHEIIARKRAETALEANSDSSPRQSPANRGARAARAILRLHNTLSKVQDQEDLAALVAEFGGQHDRLKAVIDTLQQIAKTIEEMA